MKPGENSNKTINNLIRIIYLVFFEYVLNLEKMPFQMKFFVLLNVLYFEKGLSSELEKKCYFENSKA